MKPWSLSQVNRWIGQSALDSLETAYQGALTIKAIEEQHFGSQPIMVQPEVGKTVTDYFRTQLDRELLRIRSSLFKFRLSGFLVNQEALHDSRDPGLPPGSIPPESVPPESLQPEQAVIEKLAFIESVVSKYRQIESLFGSLPPETSQVQDSQLPSSNLNAIINPAGAGLGSEQETTSTKVELVPAPASPTQPDAARPIKTVVSQSKSVKSRAPSSMRLFGGAKTISKEFTPQYEQEVIQELRVRRSQNRMAVRWLLILLLVPLLVQTVTKHLILGPVFGRYFDRNPSKVELSREVEQEFLEEFKDYREELEIKRLLAKAVIEEEQEKSPQESSESEEVIAKAIFGRNSAAMLKDMLSMQPGQFSSLVVGSGWIDVQADLEQQALQEKALELWKEARRKQLYGLRNVIADSVALLTFLGLVVFNRNRVSAIQGFSNRAFLSLNDASKVFLFILVTDMFVGFHSAEGWDVILESLAQHFGLPENQAAIKTFIATVPVIIDSCIKFWIFTYLTRYSPSTSAIYERMNT
ncbi:MAG: hypothetical protein KME07_04885 [Pegethrix bostrychoides GSE-TBD4-15B]|jgi:hypothetical protein|uniref:Proton extrusion protein PcxA n=1 Tax=Pegethrix bostrychoides GSE-TBD4-15B TaxID=2839662 RepID=A0A951U3V2_9CYAN|nr:hypothetical protein [Pegethrix bostrychoides GSE-TBD4-15B]